MSDWTGVTASNDPLVTDVGAAREVLARYQMLDDVEASVDDSGKLELYGRGWPSMVRVPDGEDPKIWEYDFQGELDTEDLPSLMAEMAPLLSGEWKVQVVGGTKCCWPLSAVQWRIAPGETEAVITHGFDG